MFVASHSVAHVPARTVPHIARPETHSRPTIARADTSITNHLFTPDHQSRALLNHNTDPHTTMFPNTLQLLRLHQLHPHRRPHQDSTAHGEVPDLPDPTHILTVDRNRHARIVPRLVPRI